MFLVYRSFFLPSVSSHLDQRVQRVFDESVIVGAMTDGKVPGKACSGKPKELMSKACGISANHLRCLEFSILAFYANSMSAAGLAVESRASSEVGAGQPAKIGPEVHSDAF